MENLLHEIAVEKGACGVSHQHYGGRDTNLQMQKMSHYRKAVMNRKVRRSQKGLVVPLECFLPPSFPEQFQPLRRLLSLLNFPL